MNNKNFLTEDIIKRKIKENFLNYYSLLDILNKNEILDMNFNANMKFYDKIWDSIYYKKDNDESINIEILKNIDITKLEPFLIQQIFIDVNTNSYSENIVDNVIISALYNKYVHNNIDFINDNYLKNMFLVLSIDLLYNNKITINNIEFIDIIPNKQTKNTTTGEFLSFINFLSLNNLINYNIVFWFFILFNNLITGIREDIFIAYLFDINDNVKIEYCKRLIYNLDITNEIIFNKIKKNLDNENILIDEINRLILSKKIKHKNILETHITKNMFYLLYIFPPTQSITKLLINKINDENILNTPTNILCKIYNTLTIFDYNDKIKFYSIDKKCLKYIYFSSTDHYLENESDFLNFNIRDYILINNLKYLFIDKLDETFKKYFDINKSYQQNLNFILNIKDKLQEITLSFYPSKKKFLNGDKKITRDTC